MNLKQRMKLYEASHQKEKLVLNESLFEQAYTDNELSDMAYKAVKWWYSQPDINSISWSDLMMKVHNVDMDSLSHEEVVKLNKYLDEYSDNMDGVREDDTASSVTDENGHAITTRGEANKWLERQIEEYGNTYFFPPNIKRILNNLIDEFGSTYFWRRVSESLSEADIPEKDPVITEPVDDEKHEAGEVTTTPEENGVQNLIQFLIKDEWDAIEGYNNTIQTLKELGGYDDLCGVLKEVSDEELVHVGQLQKALEFVNPDTAKIKEGETEATEQMTEPVVAPQEIDNV